jgi:L-fuculose-phosphate aldolase
MTTWPAPCNPSAPMGEAGAREALVSAVRRLDDLGLNQNSSGNLSVRVGEALLVTPSGIPASQLRTDDLVLVDAEGRPSTPGQRTPTSEWRLHTRIAARRPDVAAIVHTHSVEATAAAVAGSALPAVHYVVARFGADHLPCAPYATYGTTELASNVADTLGERGMAALMANHGAIALGTDLDDAVALAIDIEWFCAVVRRSGAYDHPRVLDAGEITRVAERYRTYGQQDGRSERD